MGTQKNRLNEHPKHMFKLMGKKIITINAYKISLSGSMLEKGKTCRKQVLKSMVGVARWLPSLTLENAFQLLGLYHAINKHIEILSLEIISGNIF